MIRLSVALGLGFLLAGCMQTPVESCAGTGQAFPTEGELPWVDARTWQTHLVGTGPVESNCHRLILRTGADYVLDGAFGRIQVLEVDQGRLVIRNSTLEATLLSATAESSLVVEHSTLHARSALFSEWAEVAFVDSDLATPNLATPCASASVDNWDATPWRLESARFNAEMFAFPVGPSPKFDLTGTFGCLGLEGDQVNLSGAAVDVTYLHLRADGGEQHLVLPSGRVGELTIGQEDLGRLMVERPPGSIELSRPWEGNGWIQFEGTDALRVAPDGVDGAGCYPCGGPHGTVVFVAAEADAICHSGTTDLFSTGLGSWLDLVPAPDSSAHSFSGWDLHFEAITDEGRRVLLEGWLMGQDATSQLTVPSLSKICLDDRLVPVSSLDLRVEALGSAAPGRIACADVSPAASTVTLHWIARADPAAACAISKQAAAAD